MPTQVNELYEKNKNRSKRSGSSAAFALQRNIPGGEILPSGSHVIGKIEGNICITRVTILVKEGFGGAATLGVSDNNANAYFLSQDISAPIVAESVLTANAALYPDPIYSEGVTEFTGNIGALSNDELGEVLVVVDYTQLDTVTGKHTR